MTKAKQQREIEQFLASGHHDILYRHWPGEDFFDRANHGTERLRRALLSELQVRASKATMPQPKVNAPTDVSAFTRAKVEPMVRGLFRRAECDPVLHMLEKSLVFILPETIDSLILNEGLENAWEIANIYLSGIGAERISEQAASVVGFSVETKCFVSLSYFTEHDRFADFVIHEVAHVFHNVKRRTVGLAETRRRQWLLPIEFRKRETFAYACEVYSRILEHSERPKDRQRVLAEARASTPPPKDQVDYDEYMAILSEAVTRRNGWKAILERCSTAKPQHNRTMPKSKSS